MVTVQELTDRYRLDHPDRVHPRRTSSRVPTRKVGAAGLAGGLTALVVYFAGRHGYPIDPETAAGITAITSSVIGYLVPAGPT